MVIKYFIRHIEIMKKMTWREICKGPYRADVAWPSGYISRDSCPHDRR